MSAIRLVARLDIKSPNLIKGIQLEGLQVVGDPHSFAERYYRDGVDEIIYIDSVASLYQRNTILDLVSETAKDVFVPITVGGGIRSVDDARAALRAGADKISINTAATQSPELIQEIANTFGSQCMVLSIEAKRRSGQSWHCYTDNGREHTGLNVVEWVRRGVALGAGEVLLTSVDQEGTREGFDVELISAVSDAVSVPIIASGGMGGFDHLVSAIECGADAVAMAHILHFDRFNLPQLRDMARVSDIDVRQT